MFFLFAGDYQYPLGGADDLKGIYYTYEQARKDYDQKHKSRDWAHITDSHMKILWQSNY